MNLPVFQCSSGSSVPAPSMTNTASSKGSPHCHTTAPVCPCTVNNHIQVLDRLQHVSRARTTDSGCPCFHTNLTEGTGKITSIQNIEISKSGLNTFHKQACFYLSFKICFYLLNVFNDCNIW